jgi:hypothetical protein
MFLQKKMSFGPLDPFIGCTILGTRLKKGEFLLEKIADLSIGYNGNSLRQSALHK